jgi:hypothetical protein
MIKKFHQYNESVKDLMTPKSLEDVKKAIDKLPPYKALAQANRNKVDNDIIRMCLERVKPINDKLRQDTKKFNKKTLLEFVDFVNTWIDEQGGASYSIDERFRPFAYDLTNRDEEEYEGEEMTIEESIYSDTTVESFKELMINYVIDYLGHNTYVDEEEEDEDDGTDWDIADDDDHDDEYDEEEEEEDEDGEDVERRVEREIREIEEEERLEKLEKEKLEKEKEKNKPINKIKNFLGFNRDDN